MDADHSARGHEQMILLGFLFGTGLIIALLVMAAVSK